jgi:hypothetical protein
VIRVKHACGHNVNHQVALSADAPAELYAARYRKDTERTVCLECLTEEVRRGPVEVDAPPVNWSE